MRITNKQFYESYLASYDGQTIYTILSRILFLLKKKHLALFLRVHEKQPSAATQEMADMIIALKKVGKLSRESLSALLRLVQDKAGLPAQLTVRLSKQIDEKELKMLDGCKEEMKDLSQTEALELFIQK